MEKARVSIKDFPFSLEDVYFDVFHKRGDYRNFDTSLRGKIRFNEERTSFSLKGNITRDSNENNNLSSKLMLKTGDIPLSWLPVPESMPVRNGYARTEMSIKGKLDGPLFAEGKIMVGNLHFQLIEDEVTKEFVQPRLAIDFESSYSQRNLKIQSFRIKAPDFSLAVVSDFDLKDRSNNRLTLRVKGNPMSSETFKSIFPTPLLPSWIEGRLFPIVTGGTIRVDLFSLNGTFSQIENLDLPENAGVLSMRLTMEDLEVFKDSGGLPCKGVSGQLEIKNGALLVSDVRGSFGKSSAKGGALDIKNLFADDVIYDIRLGGTFDLKDLALQRKINLIPFRIRKNLQRIEDPSGYLEASVQLRFEHGWDYPAIQKGTFTLKDCTLDQKELLFPLTLKEAEIKIDRESESLFKGEGIWGKSFFKATGSLEKSLEQGRAEIFGRADIADILNHFFRDNSLPITFSDRAQYRLSVFRKENLWSCQGMVDLEGIIMETDSFSMDPLGTHDRIIFGLDIHPGDKVNVRDLRFCLGKSTVSLNGTYNLKEIDTFKCRVSTERLLLEDLGVQFKQILSPLQGVLKCNAEVSGSVGDPIRTNVKGKMEGENFSFILGALPSPIYGGRFNLLFSGKTASILSMKMLVGKSPIHVKGDLRGWDGLKGEVIVTSDYLEVSDFVPKGAGFSLKKKREGQGRFVDRSDVRFKVKVKKGLWKKLKFNALEAISVFRSGNFYIEHSKVQTKTGILSVECDLKGGKEPDMLLTAYINMTDQPLKELLYSLGIETSYVEGRLTGEGIFYVKGREKDELISSMTGQANMLLEKGTIIKANVFIKILDFLSLQKIFKKKPPDLSKEGFYFESIKGYITMHEGVLETGNLIMKSPVFNGAAKGTIDFARKRVDYDLGIQPLGTVDWMVSKIPVLGYILTGEKKAVLVYYFKVKGSLVEPEVTYVPLKNIGGSIVNFFKRLFLTPGRLFKRIPKPSGDLEPLSEENF
jgi:hypothetical protein